MADPGILPVLGGLIRVGITFTIDLVSDLPEVHIVTQGKVHVSLKSDAHREQAPYLEQSQDLLEHGDSFEGAAGSEWSVIGL